MMNNKKTVTNIFATAGDSPGEVDLQWDSLQNATGYAVQAAKKNSSIHWKLLDIVFESKYTVNGLKPQTEYYFRVAAIFRNGQGKWSNTAIKHINTA